MGVDTFLCFMFCFSFVPTQLYVFCFIIHDTTQHATPFSLLLARSSLRFRFQVSTKTPTSVDPVLNVNVDQLEALPGAFWSPDESANAKATAAGKFFRIANPCQTVRAGKGSVLDIEATVSRTGRCYETFYIIFDNCMYRAFDLEAEGELPSVRLHGAGMVADSPHSRCVMKPLLASDMRRVCVVCVCGLCVCRVSVVCAIDNRCCCCCCGLLWFVLVESQTFLFSFSSITHPHASLSLSLSTSLSPTSFLLTLQSRHHLVSLHACFL